MSHSIFNQFINAFSGSKTAPPTKTKGVPGTAVINGFVQEDELDASLTGQAKFKTYSDLLANVSIVAAGTRYFLNLVSKARWSVVAANESEEAKRFADIITKQLTSMETSWPRIIKRAAMYRFYGFSIQEWTAIKTKDGFRFSDVAPRPQITIERWDQTPHGKVLGVTQRGVLSFDEIYLPRKKIIYMVDDSINDSPEGLGLFRHIASSCKRLQRYEQLEGYGFESDLRGIPVGRAPFAALAEAVETGLITQQDMEDAIAPITSFITNHIKNPALGLLLDSIPYQSEDESGTPSSMFQWDVSLLKGSATSFTEVANAIERVNREVARILGVDGMLLGEQGSGSNALSSDKSLNFALIVDSTLGELVHTYQRDFIERLFELNGWPMDLAPSFNTEAIQHRDITQITQALKDMAAAGGKLSMNDPAINSVREILGIPAQPKLSDKEFEAMQGKGGATTNPGRNTDDNINIDDQKGGTDDQSKS